MSAADLRKWLAVGSGIGIEIRGSDLHVVVARVRPSGVKVIGAATIGGFRERPASEWGAEYNGIMRKLGVRHLAATVLLPRNEVIVRQIELPGVAAKEMQAAAGYQIDMLHPYAEDDAVWTAARIGATGSVLVGITRRDTLEDYVNLFAEAGIKVASITFSAAAIYSALRLYRAPALSGFLALHEYGAGVEAYGESEAKPLFSAAFNGDAARSVSLASSELRLPPETEPVRLLDLLPFPKDVSKEDFEYVDALSERILPYATAITSACPRLGLPVNLLPESQRRTASRLIYIPTAVLAVGVIIAMVAWGLEGSYNNRRYLATVDAEIKKLQPEVNKVAASDKAAADVRNRIKALDDFRRRSKDDMDVLNEITRLLAPPSWATNVEILRNSVNVTGETEQAAPLIKLFDTSKLFENSEFTTPLSRVAAGELFHVRTMRRGAPKEGTAR